MESLVTAEVTFGGERRRRSAQTSMGCINISILADDIVENEEYFEVVLESDDSAVVFTNTRTRIIIEDSDSKCVMLQAGLYSRRYTSLKRL